MSQDRPVYNPPDSPTDLTAIKSELSKHGVFTTTFEEIYNWGRKNSVWPLTFGLACCAIEMIATTMARYDLARFGAEVFRPSPRQADLIIVSGDPLTNIDDLTKVECVAKNGKLQSVGSVMAPFAKSDIGENVCSSH